MTYHSSAKNMIEGWKVLHREQGKNLWDFFSNKFPQKYGKDLDKKDLNTQGFISS